MKKMVKKTAVDPSREKYSAVSFLTVDSDFAGQRLDNFLLTRLKPLPKSRLYRLIRKGEVRVNKKRIDPDYRIVADDLIRIPPLKMENNLPKKTTAIHPELAKKLSRARLYENKKILILNKPTGLAVHGGSGIGVGIIEALRLIHPQEKFLELVHRLDRETSGCLLIAKKPSILKDCHAQFRQPNGVQKYYLCLVKGHWPKKSQTVSFPIDGKSSTTHFKVIKQFAQSTLLEARLETGRNHQIRIHAQHIGHPVVGDDKYGDRDFNKLMRAYGCNRLFLHAEKLSFELEGEKVDITAPLDENLEKCLARLER